VKELRLKNLNHSRIRYYHAKQAVKIIYHRLEVLSPSHFTPWLSSAQILFHQSGLLLLALHKIIERTGYMNKDIPPGIPLW
jgi:hypothetical protein